MEGTSENSKLNLDTVSWKQSLVALEQDLDPEIFAAYIEPLEFKSFDQQSFELTLSAPSNLVKNHVKDNFSSIISKALAKGIGIDAVNIKFSVDPATRNLKSQQAAKQFVVVKKLSPGPAKLKAAKASDSDSNTELNPTYTFDNFVVGNSNQFCHAAAIRVAETPGANYNPLFIYGGVGLGKTHLLHAIGNHVLKYNPKKKVVYLSSESFTNQLISALRSAKMERFKKIFRQVDVLLIDDIQFLAGKERTQEEFFHTFNSLYNSKKQIVISSDKMPLEIPGIEERLRTRFAWGLTADLQAPEYETRVAILNKKATVEGYLVPEEVSHFIADNVFSNVRELEGALTRVYALSCVKRAPISQALAKEALKEIVRPRKINPSIREIMIVVAKFFGLKLSDLSSKRRTRNLAFPRHIAMYLCRKHTTASYPEIGLNFGGRDHSSVIHAANVVATKIKNDPEVHRLVENVEKEVLLS